MIKLKLDEDIIVPIEKSKVPLYSEVEEMNYPLGPMTREEAIAWIHSLRLHGFTEEEKQRLEQALEMAVSALKNEIRLNKIRSDDEVIEIVDKCRKECRGTCCNEQTSV